MPILYHKEFIFTLGYFEVLLLYETSRMYDLGKICDPIRENKTIERLYKFYENNHIHLKRLVITYKKC